MLKNFKWNSDFSYVIGLITTDGCLSLDKRHIDFTSKDFEQIQNFKNILKLNNKIGLKSSGTSKNKYFYLGFGNVKLYRFLISIGLTPHKSRTITALNIPDKYFKDFLRGHLDGDGSIITYIDKYNTYKGKNYSNLRIMIYFISASKVHLEWLNKEIFRLSCNRGALVDISTNNLKRRHIWRIKFSKKASLNLIRWIYYKPNIKCLQRKYNIAMSALHLADEEYRHKYIKVSENL